MANKRLAEIDIACAECGGESRYQIDIDAAAGIACPACGAALDPAAVERIRKALQRREQVLPRFGANIRKSGKRLKGKV